MTLNRTDHVLHHPRCLPSLVGGYVGKHHVSPPAQGRIDGGFEVVRHGRRRKDDDTASVRSAMSCRSQYNDAMSVAELPGGQHLYYIPAAKLDRKTDHIRLLIALLRVLYLRHGLVFHV